MMSTEPVRVRDYERCDGASSQLKQRRGGYASFGYDVKEGDCEKGKVGHSSCCVRTAPCHCCGLMFEEGAVSDAVACCDATVARCAGPN